MGIEILLALLSGLISMMAGAIASQATVEKFLRRLFKVTQRTPTATYTERLAHLTGTLKKSSADVDAIVEELATVARDREAAVLKLESDLAALTTREQELQKRVSDLQNLPLSVAEHFAAMTSAGEKRSARRDYLLFGLGVLVSTVLSIIFFSIQG